MFGNDTSTLASLFTPIKERQLASVITIADSFIEGVCVCVSEWLKSTALQTPFLSDWHVELLNLAEQFSFNFFYRQFFIHLLLSDWSWKKKHNDFK